MEFYLDQTLITINVIYKRNKNIYMRFKSRDLLEVTCYPLVSHKEIMKIIENNKEALKKMQAKKELEDISENYFCYLGKKYIKVFDSFKKEVTYDQQFIYATNEKELAKFYKSECIRLFTSEVERIAVYFPNIPKFNLKIRKMSTRWGVNNRGNNTITLNSDLLKRNLDLLDYVIIHELCHFYEANHSERFWRHVEEYYPKYKEARKRLREPI